MQFGINSFLAHFALLEKRKANKKIRAKKKRLTEKNACDIKSSFAETKIGT